MQLIGPEPTTERRSCSYDILFHDNISLVLGGMEKENQMLGIVIIVERTELVESKREHH